MGEASKVSNQLKVAVVGGSGYAGLEMIRLLRKHPQAEMRVAFSTNPNLTFADYLPGPEARGIPVVAVRQIGEWTGELDTVFLATPAEVSIELAPSLLAEGVNVIDLSGAFRLKFGTETERVAAYEKWYHLKHAHPELLNRAKYGLVPLNPELSAHRSSDPNGELIANPGCYATAVLMAIVPLLKRNLIDPESLVVDAKSGTSGAGRKAAENLLFTEVDGECLPYRIGKHQHLPEICQFAEAYSGAKIDPIFATHLLPVRRGIIAGIYAKLRPGVSDLDIAAAYGGDYSDYGLVEWGQLHGGTSRADNYALSLKRVVGSAVTRLQYQTSDGKLYLFSLIDNLIKGAAGQALENFNCLHGLPAATGLKHLEGVL